MPAEMDFKSIADFLPNLSDLHLKYTEGINVEYKKQVFGMKFAEAANLAEMLKSASNLVRRTSFSSASTCLATRLMTTSSNSSCRGLL